MSRVPFPLRAYLRSHNKKEEKTTPGVMQDIKHLHVTKLISPPVVFLSPFLSPILTYVQGELQYSHSKTAYFLHQDLKI